MQRLPKPQSPTQEPQHNPILKDAEAARVKRIEDKIEAERREVEAAEAERVRAEAAAEAMKRKVDADRLEAQRLKVINDAKMKELKAQAAREAKEAFKKAAILRRTGFDIDKEKKRIASRERSSHRRRAEEAEFERLRFEAYFEENWHEVKGEAEKRDAEIRTPGRPSSVLKMNLDWELVDDTNKPVAAAAADLPQEPAPRGSQLPTENQIAGSVGGEEVTVGGKERENEEQDLPEFLIPEEEKA